MEAWDSPKKRVQTEVRTRLPTALDIYARNRGACVWVVDENEIQPLGSC